MAAAAAMAKADFIGDRYRLIICEKCGKCEKCEDGFCADFAGLERFVGASGPDAPTAHHRTKGLRKSSSGMVRKGRGWMVGAQHVAPVHGYPQQFEIMVGLD